MLQCVEMVIAPFIDAKRATLHLDTQLLLFSTVFVGRQLLSLLGY